MIADQLANEFLDKSADAKRKKLMKRWCKMCGVRRPADIDFTNPTVHLEYILCDTRYQLMVAQPETRQNFLDILTDAEREVYLNAVDDYGNRYTDLEHPNTIRRLESDLSRIQKILSRKGSNHKSV